MTKSWDLWIVFDETGKPWTSTLAKSKRGAIGLWMEQSAGTGRAAKWIYWMAAGYRCEAVTLQRS